MTDPGQVQAEDGDEGATEAALEQGELGGLEQGALIEGGEEDEEDEEVAEESPS